MRTSSTMAMMVAASIMLAYAVPSAVMAEPTQGLGVFAGFALTNVSGEGIDADASGPGFGVDFQIPVNPQFSLNPFVAMFSEEGDDFTVTEAGTSFDVTPELDITTFGLQARFWPNEQFFVGGQVVNYDVELTLTEVTTGLTLELSESEVGFGVAAGAQIGEGLTITGQYDSVSFDDVDADTLTLLIGWRFSMP